MNRSLAGQLKGVGITSKSISQFDVFSIPDERINFPEERLGQQRRKHEARLVVILQNNKDNNDPIIPVILIAPLSTGRRYHRLDYLLAKSDHAFLKSDSHIRLRYMQPILKVDLKAKLGNISQNNIRNHIKDRLFDLYEL